MARDRLEEFLSESTIAKRATVPARVVFRRTRLTPGETGTALDSGELTLVGQPVCELVAGAVVVATGVIVERDGRHYFEAREVEE